MKHTTSVLSLFRLSLRAIPIIALLSICLPAAKASAAGLAEEHTVLYYLIEMQRRVTQSCNGNPMPPAPSLTPSSALRELAGKAAASGMPPEEFLRSNELNGIPFLVMHLPPESPKAALSRMSSTQCASLMNQEYHYIGAVKAPEQWTVLLTKTKPASPAIADSPPAPAGHRTEDSAFPPPLTASSSPVTANSAAPEAATPAGAASLGTAQAPVFAPPQGMDPNAAADPVVVKQFEVDASGKIIGTARPEPSIPGQSFSPPVRDVSPPSPAPRSAAPSPGVVPLHEHGPPAHPGGQGLFFSGETAPTGQPLPHTPAAASGQTLDLLHMVNQQRGAGRRCGEKFMEPVPALQSDPRIAAVAQAHTEDMAARGYFSSSSPQGNTLGQRISAAGYTWAYVAENIASASSSPEAVLQSWLANENQCQNLMSRDYTDAGVGYNASHKLWTLTLTAPMPDAPVYEIR